MQYCIIINDIALVMHYRALLQMPGYIYPRQDISPLWLEFIAMYMLKNIYYVVGDIFFAKYPSNEILTSAGSVIYPTDRKYMTDNVFLGPKPNRTKIRKWPKITETQF